VSLKPKAAESSQKFYLNLMLLNYHLLSVLLDPLGHENLNLTNPVQRFEARFDLIHSTLNIFWNHDMSYQCYKSESDRLLHELVHRGFAFQRLSNLVLQPAHIRDDV